MTMVRLMSMKEYESLSVTAWNIKQHPLSLNQLDALDSGNNNHNQIERQGDTSLLPAFIHFLLIIKPAVSLFLPLSSHLLSNR